ncbi:Neutral ceramidase B [Phytophthora nicotianae]|uniref:Neutral ceramidase B n=1 Tax=Phytophthora nicotianae TaxID=4792 RepID=A0A0W8DQR8_PHYNI|nr:Neutral ceramidase B [Phytophthora nicotianae]
MSEVGEEELAACIATLQKLHGEEAHQLFQSSPRFKPLRTALIPLIADLRAKFFHGNSAASDNSRQERKRAKKVERARQKALDQQYVNNTKLRAERIARLAALQAQNPLLANVPDSSNERRFIINVSAMEGKFYRSKTPNHPHTNMAKAAANMMTRTCAEDLAKKGIYMSSVDTGWINDENPRDVAVRIADTHNFQTPLDEVDAAARVLDPIFALYQQGNTDKPLYGQFLKDYAVSEW